MGKQTPGGRASTRRIAASGQQYDHGCQFFTASSPQMKQLVAQWVAEGVVAEWRPRLGVYDAASGAFARPGEPGSEAAGEGFFRCLSPSTGPLYVGLPAMDALPAHLAAQAGALRLNTRVHRARFAEGRWWLEGERVQVVSNGGVEPGLPPAPWNLGAFDAIVLTDAGTCRQGSPGHIAFEGGTPALDALRSRLATLTRVPLLSLMLAWGGSSGPGGPLLPGGWDAAQVVGGSAVQWVACDSSKPGRQRSDGLAMWVAVTRPDFAARLLGEGGAGGRLPPAGPDYQARLAAEVWGGMQQDLRAAMGIRPLNRPKHMACHRWGSALASQPLGVPAVWEAGGRWAAAGDFCAGGGVEGAAGSGLAAAEAVAGMLGLAAQG